MNKGIEVCCCYAKEDKELFGQLMTNLIPMRERGLITLWADTDINPGEPWEEKINEHLHAAEIILLLVSPDFMASEYCYGKEMAQAMKRHDDGKASVISIILRPSDWQETELGKLQALPTNAKPITQWLDRDEALLDVAKGVRKVADKWRIALEHTDGEWVRMAWMLNGLGRFDEAIVACEYAIMLNPSYANAYGNKGWALAGLERYEEALEACNKAIELGTHDANTYSHKSWALNVLKRHEEALAASNMGIELEPSNTYVHCNKAWALNALGRHEEALAASTEAIQLDPTNVYAYDQKKWALDALGQHSEVKATMKEALAACDEAIKSHPKKAVLFHNKGWILSALELYVEADEAYKKAEEIGYGRYGGVQKP